MKSLLCVSLLLGVWARCPYTNLWMKHGPERAAQILEERGGHKRRQLTETTLPNIGYGTCVYENPFAGTTDCVQFSGSGFTDASAKKACDASMGGMAVGVLAQGTRCFASTNPNLAGHCYTVEGAMEQAMPMMLGGMMMATCAQVEEACKTWSRGRFVKGGACVEGTAAPEAGAVDDHATPYASMMGASSEPVEKCQIAPGPMGAAHQHVRSPGYRADCRDAPAKNSPFQLPLKWKADHHSISLPFDETADFYTTSGTVYYDFSKNYKRSDTFFVNGTIPFGFNGPEDDWTGRNSSTMLHRQDKMYFINYMKDGSVTCTFMDMIVGNVRPDWYMDNRGAATSVQFLGNQHLYPMGSKQGDKPALVKQWRKKDFADMYFTMSVMADKSSDGHHWPVQLNVPGEGFGPDGLQSYWNHEVLPEDSDDIFFVDKNLDCKPHPVPEGGGGPPTDKKEVPSKLNTYEAGWFELEYTASPQGPSLERAMHSALGKKNTAPEAATPGIVDLAGQGELRVCEQDSGELSVSAAFTSAENSWVAVGIRPASSGRCSMVPARVNVAHQVGTDWLVHTGELVNEMRSGNTAAFLSSAQVAEGVAVNREGKKTSLSFSEPAPSDGTMKLSWAVGKSPVMSYHNARGCVAVENIPKCSDMKAASQTAVARRTAGEGGDDCQVTVDSGFNSVQNSIADLTSKLEEYMKTGTNKPKCGQFKKMAGCKRWSLFCKWNAKAKQCISL